MDFEDLSGVNNSEYFQRRGALENMLSGEKAPEFDKNGDLLSNLSSRLITNDQID